MLSAAIWKRILRLSNSASIAQWSGSSIVAYAIVRSYKNTPKSDHYETTPIQIYWKFYHEKTWKIPDTNSDTFHISTQNIECGYSLEPPRRGGSNEYPQSMFLSRNKKNNVDPCKPHKKSV